MIPNDQDLQVRLSVMWWTACLAGGVLGLRLVQLQILESVAYSQAAERNRSHVIYQTAPRGRLYDRNGLVLAANRPAFSLIYLPARGERPDLGALARDLSKQLGEDPERLLETLQQAQREETALRLAENLPPQTMFRLSELKTIYPGVDLIVEARRHYPFGSFASHLIGYMGKMDPRSWRELKTKGYRVDSRIGKVGLESVFERELRGRDGGIRMEVDAQGRLKRILERIPWEAGSNVHLTIDAAVQRAADEGLRGSATGRGAVVAMDPRSGAIRALSSAPDFDPNAFLSSEREASRGQIATLHEFNRAIAGVYPPGSAFKILVGAAGLNEGRIDPGETIFCPGHFEVGKRIFLCWEPKGHRRLSWLMGLAVSCDVYFYRMGLKTGGGTIEKYSRLFGLGAKTKVALKGEKAGHLFGPQTRSEAGRSWYEGDTVNLSIGQGELLVTPVQMAVMVSAFANRGTLWRPHFTDSIEYSGGRPEYKHKPERTGTVALKDSTWERIEEAMSLVVSSGTGRPALIPGLEVRGKTGTAQNPGGDDHAWFIAYASRPGEAPSIAVAVVVENGGHGSSVAGPIAREVMMASFGMGTRPAGLPKSTQTPAIPLPGPPLRRADLPVRTL